MHVCFFFVSTIEKLFLVIISNLSQNKNDQNEKEIVRGLHISVEVQEDILLWFAEFSIMHVSQIELLDCIR